MENKEKEQDFKENEVKEQDFKENKEAEYLEALQRLQAEFDNFRKRTEKEKILIIDSAEENLIADLLKVLDDFELSLEYAKDDGVKMIYSELYTLLENKGLKPIEAKGEFNPQYHEALMRVNGEKDNIIIEELQKGYMLNGKVIRTSKVKVSKLGENKNGEQ